MTKQEAVAQIDALTVEMKAFQATIDPAKDYVMPGQKTVQLIDALLAMGAAFRSVADQVDA